VERQSAVFGKEEVFDPRQGGAFDAFLAEEVPTLTENVTDEPDFIKSFFAGIDLQIALKKAGRVPKHEPDGDDLFGDVPTPRLRSERQEPEPESLEKAAGSSIERRKSAVREFMCNSVALGKSARDLISHAAQSSPSVAALMEEVAAEEGLI
jgi:hypothetical protein